MPQEQIAQFLDEQYVISELPSLEIGESIVLSSVTYTITGLFYPVESLPDGFYYSAENDRKEKFLIKILFKFRNPNFEPRGTVQNDLLKLKHPGLAIPVEFGIGIKKFKFKYCFEIYEIPAKITPLDKVDLSPSAVRQSFMPQIKNLLNFLHLHDFYTPFLHISNFFVVEGDEPLLLLFGYGHALMKSKFPVIEKTPFSEGNLCRYFYSPEIIEGMYSESSDYFSVGMILLRLFYPETFSPKVYESIVKNGSELKPLIEYRTDFYEVNSLVEGLTVFEEVNRLTPNEINDFIAGKRVIPHYYGSHFSFKDQVAENRLHNLGDLVELLKLSPDRFISYIKQPQNLKEITDWLNNLDGVKDLVGLKKRFIRYQNIEPEYFTEVILRHLLPSAILSLNNVEINLQNSDDLKGQLYIFFRNLEHLNYYYKDANIKFELFKFMLVCDELSSLDPAKYALLASAKESLIGFLGLGRENYIDAISKKHIHIQPIQWVQIFHHFIQNKFVRSLEGTKLEKLEDFAFYLAQHPEMMSDEYLYNDMILFLKWNGIHEIKGKSFKTLVFEILDHKVECNVSIARVDEPEAGNFKMLYSFRYSLTNYFSSMGVDLPFATEVKQQYTFSFKKSGFGYIKQSYNDFLANLEKEHSISPAKIPEHEKLQIFNTFNDTLKTEFKWQSILTNVLIAAVLGFVLSAFGVDLIVTEKIKWYLELDPGFMSFVTNVFPYILSAGITAILFILGQNLKIVAAFIMLVLLVVSGSSYLYYENLVDSVETDLAYKKELLTEHFSGDVADSKSVIISPEDLKAGFDEAFGVINSGYRPMAKYSVTENSFELQSNLKALSRTVKSIEDGTFSAKFNFIDPVNIPAEDLVGCAPIPDNTGYLNTYGYFAFKMSIDRVVFQGGKNSIFGIAFNHFYLVMTQSSIKLIKRGAGTGNKETKLLLLSEMQNYDYSIESSGTEEDILPAGMLERLYPGVVLTEKEINLNSEEFKFEATVLFGSISVNIDGKQVLVYREKNGFTDLDYDRFKPTVSMIFGLRVFIPLVRLK
ncbi:MAG: hypothetical protein IPJ75_07475 [Ignavibacteriales bacterium]|nr:hypothetical protein [Ignavibacteriales bacterium]